MTPAGPADPPPGGTAVGVDIGGTKVLGVLLAPSGAVVAEARTPTPQGGGGPVGAGGPAVADAVAVVVGRLVAAGGGEGAPPVGVGVPGMLDRRGVLRFAPNLQWATGSDVAALLAGRLAPSAVVIENDANCAALAEVELGAGRGAADVLVVTLGTGIGGGLVSGGRVVLGAAGFAGEIGHMVVDRSGPPCPCGRRGCWERYASGAGLGMLAREAAYAGRLPAVVALAGGDPEAVRGEHVTQAARTGDAGAAAVFDELGWWVALGLANLTAVVDPARIVIGGGLAEAGELLLTPTRRAYAELVEGSTHRPDIPVLRAELGERAGAVGAALAARRGGLR